jgi:RHS repeat-associated protein
VSNFGLSARVFRAFVCIFGFVFLFHSGASANPSSDTSSIEKYLSKPRVWQDELEITSSFDGSIRNLSQYQVPVELPTSRKLEQSITRLIKSIEGSQDWSNSPWVLFPKLNNASRFSPSALRSIEGEYRDFLVQHKLYLASLDRIAVKLSETSNNEKLATLTTHRQRYESLTTPLVDALGQVFSSDWDAKNFASKFISRRTQGYSLIGAFEELKESLEPQAPSILRATLLPVRPSAQSAVLPDLNTNVEVSFARSPLPIPQALDLAETEEIEFTDDIRLLAESLEHDATSILNYVQNNIEPELYAGSMKGAQATLRSGKGNSVDQSSLLIALLRVSGIPSRYVNAVVEMPVSYLSQTYGIVGASNIDEALTAAGIPHKSVIRGGQIQAFLVEYTFVSARVPYSNYRGVTVDLSGQTWLPLMPDYKQLNQVYLDERAQAVEIDLPSLKASFLSAVQEEPPIAQFLSAYQASLTAIDTGLTTESVSHRSEIVADDLGYIPNSTPFTVNNYIHESASLDDTQRHAITIRFYSGDTNASELIGSETFSLAALENQRLTVSYQAGSIDDQNTINSFGGLGFTPAYLVNLRPTVKVNGLPKLVANRSIPTGKSHRIEIVATGPGYSETVEKIAKAGGYHSIAIRAQQVYEPRDDEQAAGDSEYLAARLLSQIGYRYLSAWDKADTAFSDLNNVHVVKSTPSIVFVSNTIEISSLFGQPQDIRWQGIEIDAALRLASPIRRNDNAIAKGEWIDFSALQGSYLEHAIIENDFAVSGVSADKLMAIAVSNGNGLETFISANINEIENLALADNVISEVQDWVSRGYSVTIPESAVTDNAWNGIGWIVSHPENHEKGYFLSGGIAGGSSTPLPTNWPPELVYALSHPYIGESNSNPLAASAISILADSDNQVGSVESESNPLRVVVRDAEGRRVVGANVTFSLELAGKDSGLLSPSTGELSAFVVSQTDAYGVAEATFIHGTSTLQHKVFSKLEQTDTHYTQLGSNLITANVETENGVISTLKPFTILTGPGAPNKLVNSFSGEEPLQGSGVENGIITTFFVSVLDKYDNPISNMPVNIAESQSVGLPGTDGSPNSIVNTGRLAGDQERDSCTSNFLTFDCSLNSISFKSNPVGTGVTLFLGTSNLGTGAAGADTALNHIYSSFQYVASAAGLTQQYDFDASLRAVGTTYLFSASASGYNMISDLGEVYPKPMKAMVRWNPALVDGVPEVSIINSTFGDVLSSTLSSSSATSLEYEVTLQAETSPAENSFRTRIEYTRLEADESTVVTTNSPRVYSGDFVEPAELFLPIDLNNINSGEGVNEIVSALSESTEISFNYRLGTTPEAPTLEILEDGNEFFEGSVLLTAEQQLGTAIVPKGLKFNLGSTYSGKLWFNKNYASGDIQSENIPVNLHAPLISYVQGTDNAPANSTAGEQGLTLQSGLIKAVNRVDIANELVCYGSGQINFGITEDATVTLELFRGENTEAAPTYTITADQSFTGGSGKIIEIDLSDVQQGYYTYQLTATKVSDPSYSESATGGAFFRDLYTNPLPIGHASVQDVNIFDGSLFLSRTDISLPGRGKPITLRRSYSSSSATLGRMGVAWSHSYESKIVRSGCGGLTVVGGDGSGQTFRLENGQWTPQKGYHGSLVETIDGYDFYAKDGTRYHYKNFSFGYRHEWYLETITDTNGNTTALAYDPTANRHAKLTTVENGIHKLKFEYRTINTLDGLGPVVSTAYVCDPTQACTIDAALIIVDYAYDDLGRLMNVSYTGPSSAGLDTKSEQYRYKIEASAQYLTEEGELPLDTYYERAAIRQVEDANGNITDYTSDLHTVYIAPQVLQGSSRIPRYTNVTMRGGASAQDAQYQFDIPDLTEASRSSATVPRVTTVTDPRNNTTTYTHTAYGVPTEIDSPAGTQSVVWETSSDILLLQSTDENNVTTIFDYDQHGNKISERIDGLADSETTWTFASLGFIKNRVATLHDRNGNETRYSYDSRGNLVQVEYQTPLTVAEGLPGEYDAPDSVEELYTYSSTNGDVQSYTDANGNLSTYRYNNLGLVTEVSQALQDSTITSYMRYDALGRKTQERDARSAGSTDARYLTSYSYSGLNHLVRIQYPGGDEKVMTYDANGNRLSERDEELNTTRWQYDTFDRVIQETNANLDTRAFVYDAAGNLINESGFRAGTTKTYTYDAANRRTRETGPNQYVLNREYDGVGNVTAEYVTAVRRTEHEYDDFNRKIKTTYPDVGNDEANEESFAYDFNGNLIQFTDTNGHVTTYVYDELNRLIEQREPHERTLKKGYDAKGNIVVELDGRGGITTREYDELDRLIAERDPIQNGPSKNLLEESFPKIWEYDAVGNITRIIDRRGFVTITSYDARNRVLSSQTEAVINGEANQFVEMLYTSYDGVGNVLEQQLPNGNVLTHEYDDLYRLSSTTDLMGNVVSYGYDEDGNRTSVTDANEHTTTYGFDFLNREINVTLEDDRVSSTAYDIYGNVSSRTDMRGNTTTYEYDELNRLVLVTAPLPFAYTTEYTYDNVGNTLSETNARGHTTTHEYDELNRLIRTTSPELVSTNDPAYVQEFSYDANNNLTVSVDARGIETINAYDLNNRVTSVKRKLGNDERWVVRNRTYDAESNLIIEEDANGNSSTFSYDPRGLLIRESHPQEHVLVYQYDASGNRTQQVDPELRISEWEYDLRNRKTFEHVPSSSGDIATTEFVYDLVGNLTSKILPSGIVATWEYSYDDTNRLTTITDPDLETTVFGYDDNDNLVRQTDANQNVTRYEFDELNRRDEILYPDLVSASFGFDENGNIVSHTDPNDLVTTFEFDELNRETRKVFQEKSVSLDAQVSIVSSSYDANNNLIGVTEEYFDEARPSTSYTWVYDLFDRNTSYTDGFGRSIQYAYDNNGNRTRLTDPDNRITTYHYDGINRITSVVTDSGVTSYSYFRDGRIKRIGYPNAIEATYSYDPSGRVASIINEQNNALVSEYHYQYDINGNRTEQRETNGGQEEITTYQYDDLNRLTQVDYPNLSAVYTYDAAYNRSTEVHTDLATDVQVLNRTYHYDERNQLDSIDDHLNASASISYAYDANGNQISKTVDGVASEFIWDNRDHLRSVVQGGSTVGQFLYDAQGLRIEKVGDRGTERYTYDDQSVLIQSDDNNTTIATYRYGPDRLLSLRHNSEGLQFYLTDALNSVVNLANADGNVQARYQYDAWGNKRSEIGNSWNRFAFTGYEEDTESGLLYAKARFYDADTGRFLSQDPWEGEQMTAPSLHKYLYAYQNPTVYVDKTGQFPVLEDMVRGIGERIERSREMALQQRKQGNHATATTLGGVEFDEYGDVWSSRQNLKSAGESIDRGITSLKTLSTSSDARGALGLSIYDSVSENTSGFMRGDAQAQQNFTEFFADTGIGAASGGPTKPGLRYGPTVGESYRFAKDKIQNGLKVFRESASEPRSVGPEIRSMGEADDFYDSVESSWTNVRGVDGKLRESNGRYAQDSTAIKSTLNRPSLRAETKRKIEEAHRDPDGKYRDESGIVIEEYHYGHIEGHENRRILSAAEKLKLNQKQLNDYVNDRPQYFKIEEKRRNLSHQDEMPGSENYDHIVDDMMDYFDLE